MRPQRSPAAIPARTLVWTLTDGIAYFRGGAAPALARLGGFRTIGSDDSLFALCQDKFRSGAVLRALGLPSPECGLARDGQWIVEPPPSPAGWFVKPNRLGSKIGIWPDSHCHDLGHALELSRRVFAGYRDAVVVQPYVGGRNVRASFLAVEPDAGVGAAGAFFVDSGGDFQTMADSLALYGETGASAKAEGRYEEPKLVAVADTQPAAAAGDRADRGDADARARPARRVLGGFPRRGGRQRPSHRVRGVPRPALLRFPRLLPHGMGLEPRRRDGRDGGGEALAEPDQMLVHADAGVARGDEAELLGGAARQVEQAALDERPAIVDAHDDAAAVPAGW